MVDVSDKVKTKRFAKAQTIVKLPLEAVKALDEAQNKKGDVLHTAIIGGIMAAKQMQNLIPLCHQIPLDKVTVDISRDSADASRLIIICEVAAFHHTGVEMEAIIGSSIAACVVYDMLKAASHGIEIESTKLLVKTGGKKDYHSA